MQKQKILAAGCLAVALLSACSLDTGGEEAELRVAHLTGEKMVPPVEVIFNGTPSTAVVPFILEGSGLRYDVLIFDVDRATSATLHLGGAQENAPAVATLFSNSTGVSGTRTVLLNERLGSDDLSAGVTLQQVVNAMRAGGSYVVLYTVEFPGGALRGQLLSP